MWKSERTTFGTKSPHLSEPGLFVSATVLLILASGGYGTSASHLTLTRIREVPASYVVSRD